MRNQRTDSCIPVEGIEGMCVSKIRRVTVWGMVINIFLVVLKAVVGIIGSSQAIVADAVHSLSDLITDIAVLLGVKYWTAPADTEHPYGHRRIETLVTIFIGSLLMFVAFGIGYHAANTLHDQHVKAPELFASIGAFVSIIMKEWLYQWTKKVGIEVHSQAVVANAWHHRSDAMSSLPAFVASAIAAIAPGWAFIDHIGAIIVALFIGKVAWDIVKPAMNDLADKGVSPGELTRIMDFVTGMDQVRGIHKVRTRKLGEGIWLDLHLEVDGTLSIRNAHDISEVVKQRLLHADFGIADVIIHIEPYPKVRNKTDI
jgi:cation diffusion facilitator family transporter